MTGIWIRLDDVPPDGFVRMVVVPLLQALADNGIHTNLAPTVDKIFENEGTLELPLFPDGTLSFAYTTGPTHDYATGGMNTDRFMLATVSGIPAGLGLNEEDVSRAIDQFQSGLVERELYNARPQRVEGKSFTGRASRTTPATTSNATPAGAGQGSGGGCYVATAVYGSYDCPQVWVLRRFRDSTLESTAWGRWFIRVYYFLSPDFVRLFGSLRCFNTLLRPPLDALVAHLVARGLSSLPYEDGEAQG